MIESISVAVLWREIRGDAVIRIRPLPLISNLRRRVLSSERWFLPTATGHFSCVSERSASDTTIKR
jgi:hypothetical protein